FFQTPYVRFLHALVAVLVILQILSSSAMHMDAGHFAPWHVAGLAVPSGGGARNGALQPVLAAATLTRHGLRHFFPYLWGDTDQLKKDVLASLRLNMVPPRPRGLAAAVQGLALGALLLTVLSGLLWFILWRHGSSFPAPPLSYTRASPRSWPST
ncbi:MAG: cytochrome b/b6 domain-containing protein, partial [Bilophila sp.]